MNKPQFNTVDCMARLLEYYKEENARLREENELLKAALQEEPPLENDLEDK